MKWFNVLETLRANLAYDQLLYLCVCVCVCYEKCVFLLTQSMYMCLYAQLLPLCLTLCDPVYPQGSSVHGIFQARTLEWVAMPSFRGSS